MAAASRSSKRMSTVLCSTRCWGCSTRKFVLECVTLSSWNHLKLCSRFRSHHKLLIARDSVDQSWCFHLRCLRFWGIRRPVCMRKKRNEACDSVSLMWILESGSSASRVEILWTASIDTKARHLNINKTGNQTTTAVFIMWGSLPLYVYSSLCYNCSSACATIS